LVTLENNEKKSTSFRKNNTKNEENLFIHYPKLIDLLKLKQEFIYFDEFEYALSKLNLHMDINTLDYFRYINYLSMIRNNIDIDFTKIYLCTIDEILSKDEFIGIEDTFQVDNLIL